MHLYVICALLFLNYFSNSNNANFFKNRKSWHFDVIFDCLASRSSQVKKSLTRVDSKLGHDVDIEYSSRVRKLVSSIWIRLESWYQFLI